MFQSSDKISYYPHRSSLVKSMFTNREVTGLNSGLHATEEIKKVIKIEIDCLLLGFSNLTTNILIVETDQKKSITFPLWNKFIANSN